MRFETFFRRTERWREQYNPLRGLTMARVVAMLEAGTRGEFADLQWAYKHIEETDSTLMALVERRLGALLDLDWDVRMIAEEDLPKGKEKLAEEQRDFLKGAYDRIDNLKEAIEFLGLSIFRGFSHLQKHVNAAGEVTHLEPLDQWNWVRAGLNGDWYWNPKALNVTAESLEGNPDAQINPAHFIIRTVARPVDRVALYTYLRKGLAEKDWTAFLEIYGIPSGVVTMGPQVNESDKEEWLALAKEVAAGGSGVIPNGGAYTANDGPRGVNPFKEFIREQKENLVLAATGGLLTMLTESGSGTLAGGAHEKTFETISRADGVKLSEVFQKQFDQVLIAQAFPGQPVLAYFDLARGDISEDAAKFQREVWLGFQRDGTVSDMMANLTDLKELTAEVGLPVQPDYVEPWLPVIAEAGPAVTGEVIRDKEGDIVGGVIDPDQFRSAFPPEIPQAGGFGGAGGFGPQRPMFNRSAEGVQRFSKAVAADLQKAGARLAEIEKIADAAEQRAALKRFLELEVPALKAEAKQNPKAAEAMEQELTAALIRGWAEAKKERPAAK